MAVLAGLIAAATCAPAEDSVLAYWSFNNVDQPLQGRELGSFSASEVSGEQYNTTSRRITSNTQGVFHDKEVWLDLSNLGGEANKGSLEQTIGAWGAFFNTPKGQMGPAGGKGGSLVVVGAKANHGHYLTLKVSSKGYRGLQLRYAVRNATENSGNSQAWSYGLSQDGDYKEISNATFSDTDSKFTERSFALPEALDNREEFYLKVTFSILKGGSCALDNIAITGQATQR